MNLISKIDDFLVKKKKRERTSYYPSEVSKCLRALWYKWKNVKETNPYKPGMFWKMRMGDKIHDLIFEFLEQSGLEIVNEVSFKYDAGLKYPISGRIDNIFIDEDGVMSGIEVKSSFGNFIRSVKKDGPKKDDIDQVVTYMGCTDVKRFYLIYIARDDGWRCQFVIENIENKIDISNRFFDFFDSYFNRLINKFKYLEKVVDNNVLPERGYNAVIKNGELRVKIQKDKVEYKSDWQCISKSGGCPYREYCCEEIINKSHGKIFIGEKELCI